MFRTILLGNHIRQLTDELGRRDFPPNVPTIVLYVRGEVGLEDATVAVELLEVSYDSAIFFA